MTALAEKLLPTFNAGHNSSLGITNEDWQSVCIDPLLAEEISAKVQNHAKEAASFGSDCS
jgi:hypothetical protein